MSNINGTPNSETLIGTDLVDWIHGNGGNDVINAGAGDDDLSGDAGDDTLNGEAGNDFLGVRDGGEDIANGGAGDDTIWANSATNAALVKIYGGDGGDDVVLFGNVGATNFLVDLGAGSDRITAWGLAGQATIDAGAGDDVVRVNRTTLQVTLGAGHDFVGLDQVQATNVVTIVDFQVSGASSDRLNIFDPLRNLDWDGVTNPFTAGLVRLVQDGADTLVQMKLTQALPGQDGFHAVARLIGVQANTLTADSFNGFDPLGGANAPGVTLVGGIDADHLVGTVGGDLLQGGDGDDVLDGGAGDDVLQGGAGDDVMQPTGGGNDSLNGGDGKDTLRIIWVTNRGDRYTLNGDAGDDFLEFNSIDTNVAAVLNGGEGADQIQVVGGAGIQVYGDAGDDFIYAGDGNDILDGGTTGESSFYPYDWRGPGDTLSYMLLGRTAGVTVSLANTFAQNTGPGGVDTISNFENLHGSNYGDQLAGDDRANVILGAGGADAIFGAGGGDKLMGGDGDDELDGGAGVDRLEGGLGNDTYVVGAGDILLEQGGQGVDTVKANFNYTLDSEIENLVLLPGALVGTGNALGNVINGNVANNTIDGGGGADILFGGAGNDVLKGGEGDDQLFNGEGQATLDGAFPFNGETGSDTIDGGAGFDKAVLYGFYGIAGGVVFDGRQAAAGVAQITFGGQARGSVTNVEAFYVIGGIGGDTLTGGENADTLTGDQGDDALSGAGGDDILSGGLGGDVLDGGAGADYVSYAGAAGVTVFLGGPYLNAGEAVGDSYASIEGVIGSAHADLIGGTNAADALRGEAGNDWLLGASGADWLDGGTGNDVLEGGSGGDVLAAGSGDDVASYRQALAGVTASFSNSGANAGEAAGDVYFDVENLWGSDFADTLGGNDASGQVYGFGGTDTLYGYGGDDSLYGGEAADTLSGGTGADTFFFLLSSEGGDTIADFVSGQDRVFFSEYWFGLPIAPAGAISASRFVSGDHPVAASAGASFLFDTTSHQLLFDADGSGAQAAILMATFGNNVNLTAGDIWAA
jgi:Ca2+-binding RTX toxin-like protein